MLGVAPLSATWALENRTVAIRVRGIAQGYATEHRQQSIVEYNVTHAVRLTCQDCAKEG